MVKEKIIDSALIALSACVGFLIGAVILNATGWIDSYKVYAPTIPIQANPLYEDITA